MIYDDPRLDKFRRIFAATGDIDAAWEKVFGKDRLCNCRELQTDVNDLKERLRNATNFLDRLEDRMRYRLGAVFAQSILDDVAQALKADEAAMDLLRTPLE